MTIRNIFRSALALSLLLAPALAAAAEAKPAAAAPAPEKKEESGGPLQNMKFRGIGPAAGGGGIAAIASIPGDPNIIYLGSCSGGVFKTVDSGLTWKAIFEKYPSSIGAIALAPSNPNLVWVGTG